MTSNRRSVLAAGVLFLLACNNASHQAQAQQWITVYEDKDTRLQKLVTQPPPPTSGPTGLSQLFPITRESNLLLDSGFEDYVDEATSPWSHHPDLNVINDPAKCHSGNKCISITDSNLSRYSPSFRQAVSGLKDEWCSWGGWLKTENAGINASGCYRIQPPIHNKCQKGTTPWTFYEYVFAPCKQDPMEIGGQAYSKPDGTGWWDDLHLQRVKRPAVEMFLMEPNYKAILFDDDPLIKLMITTRANEAGGNLDPVTVGVEGTNISKTLAVNGQEIVELDGSSLPLGKHKITIFSGQHTYPHYVIEKVSAGTKPDYPWLFDERGIAIMDGHRRLVLGAYRTGGYSSAYKAYTKISEEFHEMGFNVYLNYWLADTPIEYLNVLMDNRYNHRPDPATYPYYIVPRMADQGLKFFTITEPWYKVSESYQNACKPALGTVIDDAEREKYAKCRAGELSPHLGFGGYYVSDEDPASRIYDRNFALQQWLTEADNKHPTLMVQFGPQLAEMTAWRDAVDIYGWDIYAINKASPDLNLVYDQMSIAHDSMHGTRPLWAVLQFFRGGSKGHWPSADEHRTMAYMALAAGADGILWWSWGYRALAWVKDPALRDAYITALKSVTLELRHFEAALISDPVQIAAVSDPEIKLIQRAGHIFAVNHAKADVTATFTVPSSTIDVVRGECLDRTQCSMVTDRVIDATSGSFTETFKPYEARAYVLK